MGETSRVVPGIPSPEINTFGAVIRGFSQSITGRVQTPPRATQLVPPPRSPRAKGASRSSRGGRSSDRPLSFTYVGAPRRRYPFTREERSGTTRISRRFSRAQCAFLRSGRFDFLSASSRLFGPASARFRPIGRSPPSVDPRCTAAEGLLEGKGASYKCRLGREVGRKIPTLSRWSVAAAAREFARGSRTSRDAWRVANE